MAPAESTGENVRAAFEQLINEMYQGPEGRAFVDLGLWMMKIILSASTDQRRAHHPQNQKVLTNIPQKCKTRNNTVVQHSG